MDNELIKKYLANELSPEERNVFEQEMENDPFLKDAIDGFEKSDESWTTKKLDALEENLHTQIDKKVTETESGKKVFFMQFIRYAAAACIVGIVAFATWRFAFQKTADSLSQVSNSVLMAERHFGLSFDATAFLYPLNTSGESLSIFIT